MLNIPPHDEIFYAYKMPKPSIKVEKGHTMSIINLKDIARSLSFPYECKPKVYFVYFVYFGLVLGLLKYLGYELGFKVNIKDSRLSGCCDESTIINCLDKLIRSYILCPKCCLPEVQFQRKNQTDLVRNCRACGAKTLVEGSHKIKADILKTLEPQKATHSRPSPNPEHLIGPTDKHNQALEEEEKEFEHDESFSDLEAGLISKAKKYYQHYESASDRSLAIKEMVNNMKKDLPVLHSNKIPYILFNGMFNINIAKNIDKNESLIKGIYQELMTPEPELDLLLNLETFLFVKNNKTDFEKYVATILKLFWDEGLLNDELIIDWDQEKLDNKFTMDWRYQKSVDEEFKQAARPFIDWIKNNEEDEIDNI